MAVAPHSEATAHAGAGSTDATARPGPPLRLQPVGRVEALVALAALALLAALAFGPHAVDGGFSLDDWSNASGALQSGGFGDAVSYFADVTAYRPVLVLYVPLTYELFGMRMGFHLAWAGAIGVAVSWLLYGILRTVSMPRVHAGLIASLVLLLPWLDSTRYWATASQVTLGVTFALAGIWVALVALRRGSWPLHGVALALYVTSILTYEIALPLIAAAGLTYVGAAGWRATWRRWAADLAVVVAGVAWVGSQTTREASGLDGNLRHLKDIVIQGGTLLGRTGLPVGPQRTTLVLVALAALAIAAAVAWRRGGDRLGALGRWLLLGAAGVVVAAAGWAMFIPADPYYTPSVFGFTNRVNGLAGIGLVMIVYAGLGIVGALAGRLAGGARAATAVTAALGLALGVAYATVVERHGDIWAQAYDQQMSGLYRLQALVPDPRSGETLYVSGQPQYQTLGVPIFSSTWDLNAIAKLGYDDPTLTTMPVLTGLRLECRTDGVLLAGPGVQDAATVPYGSVTLVDLPSGRVARPTSARDCRAAGEFPPGPLYLSLEY